jgi:hypothetical protein
MTIKDNLRISYPVPISIVKQLMSKYQHHIKAGFNCQVLFSLNYRSPDAERHANQERAQEKRNAGWP